MPDLPTPPPATHEHLQEARREFEEALKKPEVTERLKKNRKQLVRDVESDVKRIESGAYRNGTAPAEKNGEKKC